MGGTGDNLIVRASSLSCKLPHASTPKSVTDRAGSERLLNKVGSAALVLLRQCGPAKPDAQWKLVVGRQFSMWLQIFLAFARVTIAIQLFLPARGRPTAVRTAAGRESMLSIIMKTKPVNVAADTESPVSKNPTKTKHRCLAGSARCVDSGP